MCGRFVSASPPEEIAEYFAAMMMGDPLEPNFNVAPTLDVYVVYEDGSERNLDQFHWGLVPGFAKDIKIGNRMINARAETLMEKPSFRTALKRRRCLVPADSFYEWKLNPDGKTKTPMRMRLRSNKPFAFAGLWEHWHGDDGSELLTFTIITTSPNELLKDIHNRMPVILSGDAAQSWLSPGEADPVQMHALLQTYPAELMTAEAVGKTVNNPANDSMQCIVPL